MKPWWLADANRWSRERDAVTASYQDAAWTLDALGEVMVCELLAWPVPPPAQLRSVSADLADGRRDIGVRDFGQLAHLEGCTGPHIVQDELELLLVPQQWVRWRLVVARPPALPRLWCEEPVINHESTPEFPHINSDASACTLWTAESPWQWERGDTLLQFLRFAAIWSFKALAWLVTRRGRAFGMWIGPDASPDPRADLEALAPTSPCVCGSGVAFQRCHRTELACQAFILNIQGVPRMPPGSGRSRAALLSEWRAHSRSPGLPPPLTGRETS